MINKLVSIVIRPRLEYAGVVWSPHKKNYVWKLERLQRIAMKIECTRAKGMTYEEKLRGLDLPTLEQRREGSYYKSKN